MHFTGKQIRKFVNPYRKWHRLQELADVSFESGRRIGIDFKVNLQCLLTVDASFIIATVVPALQPADEIHQQTDFARPVAPCDLQNLGSCRLPKPLMLFLRAIQVECEG